MSSNHSFTLIELLIVIGILATLATVTVVVLNPAELLAQARDSERSQDVSTLNRVLGLYLAQGGSGFGSSNTVYLSLPNTLTNCTGTPAYTLPSLPSGWSYNCVTSTNLNKIDGTGWIPVNLNSLGAVGSPISKLPVDPTNEASTGQYYTYVTEGSFELNAMAESNKFLNGSASTDGGDDGYLLEYGSSLKLTPYTPRANTLVNKDPSKIKILVIENVNSQSYIVNCLTNLGFNVIQDYAVTTESQIASYTPNIVADFSTAWAITKYSLLNQLYNNGYRLYTEGNDTGSSIYPTTSSNSIATTAGTIAPNAVHPINQNWSTTPGSGSDTRQAILSIRTGAFSIAKDNSLGYTEAIYLEEAGKGKWFHYQPNPCPDNTLIKNALFYLAR